MKAQLADLGSTPIIVSPSEFWTFARSETEKWEKVIRQSGAKIRLTFRPKMPAIDTPIQDVVRTGTIRAAGGNRSCA